jgi:hypothetical protein
VRGKRIILLYFKSNIYVRCDQLKNKSSRRVTYGNPCYSIGSKVNSIYFLNDRSVLCRPQNFGRHCLSIQKKKKIVIRTLLSSWLPSWLRTLFYYSREVYYAGQKILAVIMSIKKKKNVIIMMNVLIMNVIFWVVNFKTQNYFVISTT